jgi:hypothetical protein
MTTTTRTPVAQVSRPPGMDSLRRTALLVGVLFVITYITSIAAKVWLYPPLVDNADYIVSAGDDTKVLWGAVAEVVLILANVGTAVALFPVVRRHFPGMALGFVAARVMESVFIAVGILSILTIVGMRQDFAGSGGAENEILTTVGQGFTTLHQWTFILGPGLTVGVGNGLLLGYMMYRSGLVPRGMAVLGLVGGSLIILSGVGMIFGVIELDSPAQLVTAIPEFFWELSFGVYLIVKGFKPSPVTAEMVD